MSADNESLRQQNEELRLLVSGLGTRLEEVEREQKRQAAPFRRREELKVAPRQQKKRGRKPGHPGAFREPPKEFDETIVVALDAWQRLWKDVLELTKKRAEFASEDFAARRTAIEARADALLMQEPTQIGDRKFRAERAIRPAVVARKISCGNKSELGARTKEIVISLLATAHQTGGDFLASLTALLNPTAPEVAPAG